MPLRLLSYSHGAHPPRQLPYHRSLRLVQDILGALEGLTDQDIALWVEKNRDTLTLSFLGWLADREDAALAEPERERLWQLGSKLMALREGFTPVARENMAAALTKLAEGAEGVTPGGQHSFPAEGSLPAAVQTNKSLGLSTQGMVLLEQQAAALEATMGANRARVLTGILGRKTVAEPDVEFAALREADAAGRILEVLVQVQDRRERAAMLPDAFSPPVESDADAAALIEDEEELSTTPLQLLQTIDLWLRRCQTAAGAASGNYGSALLPGMELEMAPEELQRVLREVREDVLATWESSSGDGEDF